ncbi:hypothetical protein LTS18_007401 [Coniosporium uncinatum]|uniref:Uncharacterized protein n=1 Tax=Coniosporium uncinatum TaxID=93489 RepID=A0ACC3D2K3_9PEZI|nr:hypothetical protein LTS18_007401 [Coniosporium uncinatum]
MADFFTNLWESVFTAGPTPTLVVATNASFCALQAVLLALYIATYSLHFIVLSFLCGGLWWGINWFVRELQEAEAKEEEAKRIRARQKGGEGDGSGEGEGGKGGDEGDDEMDEGMETEIDVSPAPTTPGAERASRRDEDLMPPPPKPSSASRSGSGPGQEGLLQGSQDSDLGAIGSETQTRLVPPDAEGMRQRNSELDFSEMSASVSGTDSEWEKVSEGGS